MSFSTPIWLYAAVPLLVLLILLTLKGSRKRQALLKSFIAEKLLPKLLESYSPIRKIIKSTLMITGIILVIISLAGPQWGYDWEKVPSRGIDVLIALDTSRSMLAQDIKPNRLERSKFAILDLLEKLESDRIGLIAFAGGAFLQCPLTLDHDAFRLTLDNINTEIIPRGGTDIAVAIEEAEMAFDKNNTHKILILITDGEDLEERGLKKAKEVSEKGVVIYTVGVGTAGGELIPVMNENGQSDFARDPDGNVIKTKLDESTLIAIAQETGGFYTPLGNTGYGLQQVYEAGLSVVPKEEREESLRKAAILRYQWPLGIACLILAIEMLLSNRRFISKSSKAAAIIALLMFPGMSQDLKAATDISRQAKIHYDLGEFEKASELYRQALEEDPDNARLKFNLATSLYKEGKLDEAESLMEGNLDQAEVALQDETFYNLGNTRYKRGRSLMQEDPEKTVEMWESAIEDYKNAMELNPNDADARYNHDLVTQQLEQLKQMMEQQQNQDQQQDQNQENQDQDENSEENQSQQNQDQQSGAGEEQESESQQGQDQGEQEQEQQSQQQEGQDGEEQDNQTAQQGEDQGDEEGEEQSKASSEQGEEEQEGQMAQSGEENADGENTETAEEARPGAMSREEARQLLDSMRNSEKKLPVTNYKLYKSKKKSRSLKDW